MNRKKTKLEEVAKEAQTIKYFLSNCEKFADLYRMSLFGYDLSHFKVSLAENEPAIPAIIQVMNGATGKEKLYNLEISFHFDEYGKTNLRNVFYNRETGECLVDIVVDNSLLEEVPLEQIGKQVKSIARETEEIGKEF